MPIRLDGDEEAVTYFDELLPAEKGRQRALRLAELAAIGEMALPFSARFMTPGRPRPFLSFLGLP